MPRSPLRLTGLAVAVLVVLVPLTGAETAAERTYKPNYKSLAKHPLPTWYDDAKLGIFIHWGIYSVPAWAPPAGKFGELPEEEFFQHNPYAEWYFNSMRFEGSDTQRHHREVHGDDFDYYRFGDTFNRRIDRWDPAAMADLFASVHARYVVLTTKHHDGFTLWPSEVRNPHRPGAHAARDIVGELNAAVTQRGLRMGLYYSGGIDWSFHPVLIDGSQTGEDVTPGGDYAAYADAHLRELIARYRPSILWNDIRYPQSSDLLQILADLYNDDADVVINNRWGGHWVPPDFTTAEYKVLADIESQKWEANRGIGNSFGYNQAEGLEHFMSVDELVDSFIDIVSKNGNLLLNVGPQPDGTIPPMQVERLRGLGRWLDLNGKAIFGTRPWVMAEGRLRDEAVRVRFTYGPPASAEDDTATGVTYLHLLDEPVRRTIVLEDVVPSAAATSVRLLGHEHPLKFRRVGDALEIILPPKWPEAPAHVVVISPQPHCLMQK